MPPSFDFADLWSKESDEGTPVVVTMENPNWSMPALENQQSDGFQGEKDRGRNAKQLTWVLLLKAHRAVGCVAWLAMGLWTVLGVVKKRLIFRQGVAMDSDHMAPKGKLFMLIRTFLVFAVATLLFEILAYAMGWHFCRPHLHVEVEGILHWIYLSWVSFRTDYIAPPLQALADICIVLFLIQSADRLILSIGCFWIKYKKIKPKPKEGASEYEDVEQPGAGYPMVLVQIPMCNEREVYQQSISAVCQLDWPKERILIQVLDDSDEEVVQLLIKAEVKKWSQTGISILYRHRMIRTGYKAGNLNSAMNCDYVKDYEFVAIFDADFQPKPDFLKKTVPHFKDNPELGLVQARWAFVNKDENLLTRLQNINLSFHFEVEQQVNGVFINFFGFNGTAGVWRIKALEESGGWLERTTVEDMDIAVRAHLNGWKFIFLNDVQVLCELPESYEAYRKQQHRWHSGPMHLFRLCLPDIISSKMSIWKKANIILLFFLLRKLILPFYSFMLFCILLPLTMFVPEAHLPIWVICYVPALMSFLNVLPAPKSFPFIMPYLLFENTMSVTKFNAMVSGLFQLGSAYEWVVTKKMGRSSELDLLEVVEREPMPLSQHHHRGISESSIDKLTKITEKQHLPQKRKLNRLYRKELALAFLLLVASARSLLSAQGIHFYFLLFQGVSFLIVGLDLVGEQVS